MRAKWRKIIWAILALQLLVLHVLFLERANRLELYIYRVATHFGLPDFLYTGWKQLALLGWLVTAGAILLWHYRNYIKFRRWCIGQICTVQEESVRQSLREAVLETGLGKSAAVRERGRAGKGRTGTETIGKEGAEESPAVTDGNGKRERAFLYLAKGIEEPFVLGFHNPILLLPDREFGESALKCIFLHECRHIRQRDTLYKLFWLLMRSLLWFQPLIYLLAALGSRDVEVACDEAVVEGKDMEARKEYGYALLECLQLNQGKGQMYSAYFYHGKRLMKARISAVMKQDRKWDALAYVSIAVLLLDLGFNFCRVGEVLRESRQTGGEEPLTSIYEGCGLPESFVQSAVLKMTDLEPVGEDAYYKEWRAEDGYARKEYGELPYEADGPWQVRLEDANDYAVAVGLLAERYLCYYTDWKWATKRNLEMNPRVLLLDYVRERLLAGNKQDCVYALAFRYLVGTWEDVEQFPEELAQRARFVCEDGLVYYAYFDWTMRMRMVKDYVFELEAVAETDQVLEAFREKYGQAEFSDVPVLDLADEVQQSGEAGGFLAGGNPPESLVAAETPGDDTEPESPMIAGGPEDAAEPAEAYQMEIRENALWVSDGNGVFRQVPVPMETLLARGDEMDGSLTSLPAESFQLDKRKQIFAYGGSWETPFAVVYYDEEKGDFRKSVVTADFWGGRRIFVDFPENSQDGFLLLTGERVVWQETSILFRTRDGGETWQKVGAAGSDLDDGGHSLTMDADFIDNQVGFVTIRSSEEPAIWRTADGGEHWTKLELPYVPEGYLTAYAPEPRGRELALYVGMEDYSRYGGKKAKYESTDQGETWEYKGFVLRK